MDIGENMKFKNQILGVFLAIVFVLLTGCSISSDDSTLSTQHHLTATEITLIKESDLKLINDDHFSLISSKD